MRFICGLFRNSNGKLQSGDRFIRSGEDASHYLNGFRMIGAKNTLKFHSGPTLSGEIT